MADIKPGAIGTRELLEQFSFRIYEEAKAKRRSVSQHLERLSPTDNQDRSGLDAFGRLMMEADLVSRSYPEEGIYANTFEDFVTNRGKNVRALFPEWAWRQWRAAQRRPRNQRALTSVDFPVNTAMRPYVDNLQIESDDFQPAVPVAEVVAASRGIDGNAFRALYLEEPAAAKKRFVRIGEMAEIPKVTIRVGQHIIDMYKYGRGIEFSYELLRRESLDRVAMIIQLTSVQNEIDKLATIIDVMVNGDGNSGTTPTSYNLTTLDPSTSANVPTYAAYLAFKNKWVNPYSISTILATEAAGTKLQLLNSGSANLPIATLPVSLVGAIVPINQRLSDAVRLGLTEDAPANKWLGFDRRTAIERVFEIGADLTETERWVSNQTEAIFFSEVEGYRVINHNAVKIVNLAA